MTDIPQLEEHTTITAPLDRVWALVSDVRRMPEWSPTVSSTRLRAGFDRVELGAEFTNLNIEGELEWKTRGTVVRFAPERELAFRIAANWVVWAFQLDEVDGGTLLTQRRETPDGISPESLALTDAYLGGQETFTANLAAGMVETLRRIKAAAEAA